MCVTRVGRVLSVEGDKAVVKLFDDSTLHDIDVSLVKVRKNSYVEVFANLALKRLRQEDAESRMELWSELRRAAGAVR